MSLGTISVGWLFYRPLVGIPLALLAVGSVVLVVVLLRKRAATMAAEVATNTTTGQPGNLAA